MKKETLIECIVIIILSCVLVILISMRLDLKTNTISKKNDKSMVGSDFSNVETKGALEVTDEQTLSGSYTSSSSDESVIKVSEGGNLTLDMVTINKTGDSTNTENSEFYGVNAAVLTTTGATTTIKKSNITTSAKGANAVFATGENAKVYISDSTITSTGSSSARGLDSTYGGYIEADNVTISTEGGSCATLATDRGEGTVIARNSKLSTKGAGSPIIYSTGEITLESSEGVASGSQMVVVEGKNTATVKNSVLSCSGKGNRNSVDDSGIMIYQSMSGDASEGTGSFISENSTLEIDSTSDKYKTSPMFFVTNTDAKINLKNTTLKYGSNVLLKVEGTDEWGKSGANGGNVSFNAENQSLEGSIEIDKLSTLELNLSTCTFVGSINTDNTASSVKLILDKDSKVTLTGDTYLTSLEDADASYSNINLNGYKLYVDGKEIK